FSLASGIGFASRSRTGVPEASSAREKKTCKGRDYKETLLWQKTRTILVKSCASQNAPAKTPISVHSIRHSLPRCDRKTAKKRQLPHRHQGCLRPSWCRLISRRIPPTHCATPLA